MGHLFVCPATPWKYEPWGGWAGLFSAVFTAASPMLRTVLAAQEILSRHFWKEGINELMKSQLLPGMPSWASVLILMHCTGCYSLMLMSALFNLPAMLFLTFIHLENSYSSFKTAQTSSLYHLDPTTCMLFLPTSSHFILTLLFTPHRNTEFLLSARHWSRWWRDSRQQKSSLPSGCLQSGEEDKQWSTYELVMEGQR